MAVLPIVYLWVLVTLHTVVYSSRLLGIPTIPFDVADYGGTYDIRNIRSIIVDSAYADRVDESGETLIPQTLKEFGDVFMSDMLEIYRLEDLSLRVGSTRQADSIFLTMSETLNYPYASGEPSAEGFILEVSPLGIVVRGASPLGMWWGTRSLMQLAILSEGNLPHGTSVDFPGWRTRGMMLDVARKYYPSEFIADICSYMSFFKQNTLQLHLSDNLYNNVKIYSRERSLSLYARFRLWSDAPEVEGLNKFRNESYTKEDFKDLQLACASRGVTIIPEIEAPGHALPIVQWKPELGLNTDLSLLNISHPDTIPTMKTIWSTFFDWFDTKIVHIGADEYTADVNEYNRFVNEMAEFIRDEGNKSVRIWGTFPPKTEYENNISTDVSIQHWEFFEDNPLFDYIQNNYSVMNSDDTYYVVNKWSGSYPQKVNINKTFHGDPATGGPWRPYIFDTKNSTNNPERTNKAVLGSIAPLWNDFGPNASIVGETYYAWREGIPALADKQWGGNLLAEELMYALPILHPFVPDQDLETVIDSRTPVILRYDWKSWAHPEPKENWKILDQSGNGYDALTDCARTPNETIRITTGCSIGTGILSKARDYSLTLRLYIEGLERGADATVISGSYSTLLLTPSVTLLADGNYYRLNATVPLGTWVDLSIIGRGERTFASVNRVDLDDPFREATAVARAEEEEEFQAVLGVNGESFVWAPIAVEAPTTTLSGEGWTGEFAGMILSSEA